MNSVSSRYISVITIHGTEEDDCYCEYVDLNKLTVNEEWYLLELQKSYQECAKECQGVTVRGLITDEYGVDPIPNITILNTYIIWEIDSLSNT
jgi:hypothetical protein